MFRTLFSHQHVYLHYYAVLKIRNNFFKLFFYICLLKKKLLLISNANTMRANKKRPGKLRGMQ
jgi:hypothetical protein